MKIKYDNFDNKIAWFNLFCFRLDLLIDYERNIPCNYRCFAYISFLSFRHGILQHCDLMRLPS